MQLTLSMLVVANTLLLWPSSINCSHQYYDASISAFQPQSGYNKPMDFVSPQFYANANNAVRTVRKTKQLLSNYIGKLKQNLNSVKRLESPDLIYNFYNDVALMVATLERNTKKFYQSARNESVQLLGRMKKIEIRFMPVRDEISDYYHEMDQFVYVFTITIDNFDEFIAEQLRRVRTSFENVANIQKDILGRRKLLQEEWCQINYKQFMVLTSAQIHKCTQANLKIVYDVFAISKLNILYLIGQLEHRIQKVFNCLEKKNYQLYCRFIKQTAEEFENIFGKLNELLIYSDKQKLSRDLLMKAYQKNERNATTDQSDVMQKIYCLPHNYPEEQLMDGLQSCFSYWN